jgi:hypothetical protein
MIKFVLISVAAVLVLLGIYTYSQQTESKPTVSTSPVTEKKVTVEEKKEVLPQTQHVTKQETLPKKEMTTASPKVVSHESTQERGNEMEIGKGLTLEDIENADVSEEEKERMRDDLALYLDLHTPPSEPLSDEEILETIKEDLKKNPDQEN